jgi:hypothetical protein
MKGVKRARNAQEPPCAPEGHAQLLIVSRELQRRLGGKYYDEKELIPLLISRGICRRVLTFELEIRPLGGDSLKIQVDTAKPKAAEVKAEIARDQGIPERLQELYTVAIREDGGVVREDDAEPELLTDDQDVRQGTVLTLAVKEEWLVWASYDQRTVDLSEKGAIATRNSDCDYVLVTTNEAMATGRHYWEVELMSQTMACTFIGVSRRDLENIGDYAERTCTDAWLIYAGDGTLWGNGKADDDLGTV